MNKKKAYVLIFSGIGCFSLFFFLLIPLMANFDSALGVPNMVFPVQDSGNVTDLRGYNYPDWGEPGKRHNGIDLKIVNHTTLVSPVNGMVLSITENQNPYHPYIMFHVAIMINYYWTVTLVIEPGLNTSALNALQRAMITVQPFQQVSAGQAIATILEGEYYPHLHFMLANSFLGPSNPYSYSNPSAKSTYEAISTLLGGEPIYYEGLNMENVATSLTTYGVMIGIICAIILIPLWIRRRRRKRKLNTS